jgi:hypothetical protein
LSKKEETQGIKEAKPTTNQEQPGQPKNGEIAKHPVG